MACGNNGIKQPIAAGVYAKTLQHQGRIRNYRVDIPTGYDPASKNYPLIFLIHGRGGTATSFQNQTSMGTKANAKGYLVVTPEGTESTLLPGQTTPAGLVFNAGFNKAAVADQTVDDVDFLTTLMDSIQNEYAIDCQRIFMTGFSMGAMMTYKMASKIPQRLAGIGIVAGTIGSTASNIDPALNAIQTQTPSISLPLISIHSTDDNAVWYDGCQTTGHSYFPVIDQVACSNNVSSVGYYKSNLNNCQSELVTSVSTTATKHKYYNCSKINTTSTIEAEVEFYKLTTGSHRWPGGSDSNANQDINATELILAFFDRMKR